MTSTPATKKSEINVKWHHIDANGKVLGRLSSEIVKLLMGKHKVTYVPYLNSGDKVVVTNVAKVKVTGKKETDKIYNRHTLNVKGYYQENVAHLRERKPAELIKRAITGMLPKNKLRKVRLSNLILIDGEVNPHSSQTDK